MSSAIGSSIEDVRDRLSDLSTRLDALSNWIENTHDRIAELEDENERLRAELEEVRTTAEQAMTVASRGHNPQTESKVEVAKRLTRNELVRRVAQGAACGDRPITASEVKEMARPDRELAYQSVKDGWGDLVTEWGCFYETTKKGNKAIGVRPRAINCALTRAVEVDLGRDDLTKSIISPEAGEGGER